MSIVSEIWTWQEGTRVYSRFTTNVASHRFLTRLAALGLKDFAETVHAYSADRAFGGSGYEILWKIGVDLDFLRRCLLRM